MLSWIKLSNTVYLKFFNGFWTLQNFISSLMSGHSHFPSNVQIPVYFYKNRISSYFNKAYSCIKIAVSHENCFLAIFLHSHTKNDSAYLQISINKIKQEDSQNTNKKLCRFVKFAEINSKDNYIIYWFDVWWHNLGFWWYADRNVFPRGIEFHIHDS